MAPEERRSISNMCSLVQAWNQNCSPRLCRSACTYYINSVVQIHQQNLEEYTKDDTNDDLDESQSGLEEDNEGSHSVLQDESEGSQSGLQDNGKSLLGLQDCLQSSCSSSLGTILNARSFSSFASTSSITGPVFADYGLEAELKESVDESEEVIQLYPASMPQLGLCSHESNSKECNSPSPSISYNEKQPYLDEEVITEAGDGFLDFTQTPILYQPPVENVPATVPQFDTIYIEYLQRMSRPVSKKEMEQLQFVTEITTAVIDTMQSPSSLPKDDKWIDEATPRSAYSVEGFPSPSERRFQRRFRFPWILFESPLTFSRRVVFRYHRWGSMQSRILYWVLFFMLFI